ncbi:hypothetical protein HMPREF0372_02247, partial [Flavonifractor plautii ATCC 29863]
QTKVRKNLDTTGRGPVLVIGAFPLSFITRLTRTSLVEVQ